MSLHVNVPALPSYCGRYEPVGERVWAMGHMRLYDARGFWVIGTIDDVPEGIGWVASCDPADTAQPADVSRWRYFSQEADCWVESSDLVVEQADRGASPDPPAISKWCVVGGGGAIVREGEALSSPLVQQEQLPQGSLVTVLEVRGRRARIAAPAGWVSVTATTGEPIVAPMSGNDHMSVMSTSPAMTPQRTPGLQPAAALGGQVVGAVPVASPSQQITESLMHMVLPIRVQYAVNVDIDQQQLAQTPARVVGVSAGEATLLADSGQQQQPQAIQGRSQPSQSQSGYDSVARSHASGAHHVATPASHAEPEPKAASLQGTPSHHPSALRSAPSQAEPGNRQSATFANPVSYHLHISGSTAASTHGVKDDSRPSMVSVPESGGARGDDGSGSPTQESQSATPSHRFTTPQQSSVVHIPQSSQPMVSVPQTAERQHDSDALVSVGTTAVTRSPAHIASVSPVSSFQHSMGQGAVAQPSVVTSQPQRSPVHAAVSVPATQHSEYVSRAEGSYGQEFAVPRNSPSLAAQDDFAMHHTASTMHHSRTSVPAQRSVHSAAPLSHHSAELHGGGVSAAISIGHTSRNDPAGLPQDTNSVHSSGAHPSTAAPQTPTHGLQLTPQHPQAGANSPPFVGRAGLTTSPLPDGVSLVGTWHVETKNCPQHTDSCYTIEVQKQEADGRLRGEYTRAGMGGPPKPVRGQYNDTWRIAEVLIEWAVGHTSTMRLHVDPERAPDGAYTLRGAFINDYDATKGDVTVVVVGVGGAAPVDHDAPPVRAALDITDIEYTEPPMPLAVSVVWQNAALSLQDAKQLQECVTRDVSAALGVDVDQLCIVGKGKDAKLRITALAGGIPARTLRERYEGMEAMGELPLPETKAALQALDLSYTNPTPESHLHPTLQEHVVSHSPPGGPPSPYRQPHVVAAQGSYPTPAPGQATVQGQGHSPRSFGPKHDSFASSFPSAEVGGFVTAGAAARFTSPIRRVPPGQADFESRMREINSKRSALTGLAMAR